MQTIQLSDPERVLLERILTSTLGEVRSGVRRTHNPAWHDGLKQDEELIRTLLGKLGTG